MDTSFLTTTALFRGISAGEITSMLDCLQAVQKHYDKGDTVYHAGTTVTSLGVVLSGSVFIENDDFWGNKNVLDKVLPGEVFAETYASIPGEPLMFNVTAAETTEILFLNVQRLLAVCPHSCTYHHRLVENLLSISAQKNIHLSRRSLHTAPKTIRGRLLFLIRQSGRAAAILSFHLTDSSLPTISTSTAVRSPMSLARCSVMVCSVWRKTTSICPPMKWNFICNILLPVSYCSRKQISPVAASMLSTMARDSN